MNIAGIQRCTLLDYPGKIAATVFTPSCPLRCPYCHNSKLASAAVNDGTIDVDEVFQLLEKRRSVLDGICISGGEPLMQKNLLPFIKDVKAMGFDVKLDTSGFYPEQLETLLEQELVDMVALDIKHTWDLYPLIAKTKPKQTERFQKSLSILLASNVELELRTTIVKDFHREEDLYEMAKLLQPYEAIPWYWQNFVDSKNCFEEDLSAYDPSTLKMFYKNALSIRKNIVLRGEL